MTITTYETDDLIIDVTVTFDPSAEIQALTGGEVGAFARSSAGVLVDATSCEVTAADRVKVVFADGSFQAGFYGLQVRATVDGNTQTIAEEGISVKASF